MSNVPNNPIGINVQINVTDNPILIIGGGDTAFTVLQWILSINENAKVKVVSPSVDESIKSLAWKKENIKLIRSVYMLSDLDGIRAVIATTGDPKLNERIKRTVAARNTWVSFPKEPQISDFTLPLEVWQEQAIAS